MKHKQHTHVFLPRAGILTAIVLVIAFTVASCKKTPPLTAQQDQAQPAATDSVVNLNGAGATFPYPLYSKWFAIYGETHQHARINYQSIGSGGGIKQLQANTVDFGASDAPLSDEELKMMPAPVVQLPMVAGAVVLAYNLPGISDRVKLTPEVVAGIFLGAITTWSDSRIASVNPTLKLPNLAIAVAHRSDGSGTTYIFTHYLAAVSNTWASRVGSGKSVNWPAGIGGKGNEGVAGLLKQTPGSIGYVELAYAEQNALPYAAIRNQTGTFVTPSIASTKAAANGAAEAMRKDARVSIVNAPGKDAYPISGFTYLLLYQQQPDHTKGAELVDFLWWAIHDGQQHAAPLLYAPLPAAVTALNEHLLGTVTSNGKPLHATH